MTGPFGQALARVPDLLASHVLLAASALLLGLAISLPLAILSARNAYVARVSLGFASLVQTIPSLALLALFYPLLLSLSALTLGERHQQAPTRARSAAPRTRSAASAVAAERQLRPAVQL